MAGRHLIEYQKDTEPYRDEDKVDILDETAEGAYPLSEEGTEKRLIGKNFSCWRRKGVRPRVTFTQSGFLSSQKRVVEAHIKVKNFTRDDDGKTGKKDYTHLPSPAILSYLKHKEEEVAVPKSGKREVVGYVRLTLA